MSTLDRVRLVRGDITREEVDVIVNAANSRLRGGGGVDGAIHRAAGPALVKECIERYPEGCPTGEARITSGHDLAAGHVIHVVGPVWRGGSRGEPEQLASCYRQALTLAGEHGLETIAFPAVSCGVYGYPWLEAAEVALGAIEEGLRGLPEIREVRMVLFEEELLEVFRTALEERRSRG